MEFDSFSIQTNIFFTQFSLYLYIFFNIFSISDAWVDINLIYIYLIRKLLAKYIRKRSKFLIKLVT